MNYTKYERARIIGARALQIGMRAPFLLNLSKEDLERMKYNPIEIAKLEFNKGLVPITVKRELPKPEQKTPQKKVRKLFQIDEISEEAEPEPQQPGS